MHFLISANAVPTPSFAFSAKAISSSQGREYMGQTENFIAAGYRQPFQK